MSASIEVLRLQQGDDLSGVTGLLQRFFHEEGFETADHIIARNTKTMAGLDMCGLFVAKAGDDAIGVATVSMEFGIEYGWSAEMGDLYVVPDWRGRGVSRQLLEAVETYLRSKLAFGYQVTVTPFAETHHGLATFYSSLGFANEGRQLMYKNLERDP